ncbi:MAG: hypothetical protein ACOYON_11360 [Fimbriimonas sp.]
MGVLPLVFAFFAPATAQSPIVATPFATAPAVAETIRLAATPSLDGIASPEEWDPFSPKTFFQWEPNRLHFGAAVPSGSELVASIDLNSDGWLIGNDNIEVRVGADGKIHARKLDATRSEGPRWVPFAELELSSKAAAGTATELTLIDPGLKIFPIDAGAKVGVRIDVVPEAEAAPEPFLPRALAAVTLGFDRATALPVALKWKVERTGRVASGGESANIRFAFSGDAKVQPVSVTLRSEGKVRDATTQITQPFPNFDRKGRAFVDYSTPIRTETEPGYRIAQAQLKLADGPATVQASFRIAPTVEIELVQRPVSGKNPTTYQRFSYYVRSNVGSRVDGITTIKVPAPLKLVGDMEDRFVIYNSRASTRKIIELDVPVGLEGTFPLSFTIKLGEKELTQVEYLTIKRK